jgi:hypothetical protein
LAKVDDSRIIKVLVKLFHAGAPKERDETENCSHGKLGLMDRLGIQSGTEDIDCAFMNMGGDANNILRKQIVRHNHLEQGVRCRVSMAATRVIFK